MPRGEPLAPADAARQTPAAVLTEADVRHHV